MANETKHTPTPWRGIASATAKRGSVTIETADGTQGPLAFVPPWGEERDANAARIVRAVNAHDALVSALRECLESMRWAQDALKVREDSSFAENMRDARAALRLAERE